MMRVAYGLGLGYLGLCGLALAGRSAAAVDRRSGHAGRDPCGRRPGARWAAAGWFAAHPPALQRRRGGGGAARVAAARRATRAASYSGRLLRPGGQDRPRAATIEACRRLAPARGGHRVRHRPPGGRRGRRPVGRPHDAAGAATTRRRTSRRSTTPAWPNTRWAIDPRRARTSTRFLELYRADDGWIRNAREVLGRPGNEAVEASPPRPTRAQRDGDLLLRPGR